MRLKAIRRHHEQRIKKKRSKYFNCWNPDDPVLVGIISKTPKPCSCYSCGNPRKHFKIKTYQERKANDL